MRSLAETILSKVRRARGMDGAYYPTGAAAREAILQEIPAGSVVTWGGSMTIEEIGLAEAIRSDPAYRFLDRRTAVTPEEKRTLYAQQTLADYFLM
jgi:hypothetical protein